MEDKTTLELVDELLRRCAQTKGLSTVSNDKLRKLYDYCDEQLYYNWCDGIF